MKLSILFIPLLLTNLVAAQPSDKLRQLLQQKDLPALQQYVDRLQKKDISIKWDLLRPIVGEYREGVIKKGEMEIRLLATEKEIFYYKLTDGKHQEEVKDTTGYAGFENAFKAIYQDTVQTNDLFQTSIVYGQGCGFVGVDPLYLDALNALLTTKRSDIIFQWLKSPNAEKQLYAIRGYRQLAIQGYHITDEEKRILEIVKQKKVYVSWCGGCVYMGMPFDRLIAQIDSVDPKQLKKPANKPIPPYGYSYREKDSSSMWMIAVVAGVVIMGLLYGMRRKKKSILIAK